MELKAPRVMSSPMDGQVMHLGKEWVDHKGYFVEHYRYECYSSGETFTTTEVDEYNLYLIGELERVVEDLENARS